MTTAATTGGEPRRPRSGRLPLAIALVVVAALGIGYWMYVRGQRAYFSSRNLRLLDTVSGQLDEALRTNEGFVRNYGASRDTPESYLRGSNRPSTEKSSTDPAIFLPRFDSASRTCAPTTTQPESRPSFTRTLEWERSEPLLTIGYQEVAAPLPPVPSPGGVTRASPPPIDLPVFPLPAPTSQTPVIRPCDGADLMVRGATGKIALRAILEPIFSQPLLSAFDDVMLVRGDGMVIFTGHQHERGALTRGGERSLQDHVVANLGTLAERIGWRETKQLDMAGVRNVTRISEVQSSSGTYYLFTQPFTHDTVDHDTASNKPEARAWIVAGMVSKRRFMYEVLSVSTTGVLAVLAVMLMMICAWPYLRTSLIGAHQRLTIADVLLLGTAALIHASVLTLIVVDVLAYRSLRKVSDQQLRLFANRLEADLYEDLRTAAQTLKKLDAWARSDAAKPLWARSDLISGLAAEGSIVRANLPNPYVSNAAWIDVDGRQRFKASMRRATPLVNVAHRRYFQDAKMNRLQQVGENERVAIESIRSSTTGETEVVLSQPSGAEGLPVVAATVQLVSVRHAVLPPGFGFAMIDESGKVIFHSEESRNNQENFFAEIDWDRTVRSAVYAQNERTASVRYWGADHEVYVRPLKLPWTLIVFRNKSLLRTVNTETVAMTLSMLLGNAAIYLVVLFLVLLWKPRYRAPHIWPVARNYKLYLRLIVLYAVTIVAASVSFYALDARSVLLITMLVPAQAMAGTLLVLEERRHESLRWRMALLVWVVVTLVWLIVLANSTTMPGTAVAEAWGAIIAAALVMLAATAWATFSRVDYRLDVPYSRAYIAAGVLLLTVGAVIPAFGFFKVASRLEIEGLVKYSQLLIAEQAEKAIIATEAANTADESKEAYCADWTGDPFGTSWHLDPEQAACRERVAKLDERGLVPDRVWLPEVYRDVLPAYSEESVSLRQLHGSFDPEAPWRWWWKGDRVTLEKAINLPVLGEDGGQGAASNIYGGNNVPAAQSIHVQMRVPLSFAAAWYTTSGWTSRVTIWLIVLLLAVVAVIAVLIWIVRFFASKLFLIDIQVPLWLTPPPPLKPTLGDHLFLIRDAKSEKKLTDARDEQRVFIDVRFASLGEAGQWDDMLLAIDRAAEGQNVRIVDFDHDAANPATSLRKLTFLERLLALSNRTVVVESAITPAAFLALIDDAALRQRWTAVLNSFVWATESQMEGVPDEDDGPTPHDNEEWLLRETGHGAFLKGLGAELQSSANATPREALIDEILERASTHYAGLWASCSPPEKILLHQLAREGLINGKDRKSVRRLLARGLVRRRPNLRLFNDTFRLFVLNAARREQVPVDTQEGPSAWDTIRFPLFVVFVSVVIMILATQKDLLNMTTGLVAALTTGLPAIVRLFGFLTEKRLGGGEKG